MYSALYRVFLPVRPLWSKALTLPYLPPKCCLELKHSSGLRLRSILKATTQPHRAEYEYTKISVLNMPGPATVSLFSLAILALYDYPSSPS